MKVKKLSLTNYRGVKSLSFDFDKNLNVFLGDNGAGKSTILDALAIILSWVVNRIKYSGSSGRPIMEIDINNDTAHSSIEVYCETKNSPAQNIGWKLVKSRKGYAAQDRSNFGDLSEFTKKFQEQMAEKSLNINLPVFIYYPINRAVLDIPLRIRQKHTFSPLTAYDDALTGGANFRTFFEWFREREDLENENIKNLKTGEHIGSPLQMDKQLEAVRSALKQFLPTFENLTIRRNPLRMEIEKNGNRLIVNQLSDGEKCMIAMIGDIARRMAIANPSYENPLNSEGVVIIDEIDLHLHPSWQHMIIPKLMSVFPNCQFIISTHSPLVITNVKPDNIYLLRQNNTGIVYEKFYESYGKNADIIFEDIMGLTTTRPDKVTEKINELFEKIDSGKLVEARRMIESLKENIGQDPELIKAEILIKRKEIIGR